MRRRIFVFGSNMAGIHGRGAALYAKEHYGAQQGVGEGLTGDAYALPTKRRPDLDLDERAVQQAITRFVQFAYDHPEMDFLLTAVGCGLAGYRTQTIWSMFPELPANVYVQSRLCQTQE